MSIFLSNIHHAYAQTDGTYAFPNSNEGDMLKQAKKEIEALQRELNLCKSFHDLAVKERDLERRRLAWAEADRLWNLSRWRMNDETGKY
jgi:hypothetical protein